MLLVLLLIHEAHSVPELHVLLLLSVPINQFKGLPDTAKLGKKMESLLQVLFLFLEHLFISVNDCVKRIEPKPYPTLKTPLQIVLVGPGIHSWNVAFAVDGVELIVNLLIWFQYILVDFVVII